ncbi:MAG: response regulator [Planctomycetaceae bacterium]
MSAEDSHAAARTFRHSAVGRPMEILLVEDSLTSARLTMAALRKGDVQHRLTWLTDGHEATEFLFRRGKYVHAPRPDLILLDLQLPGRDGLELLADLKADDDLTGLPVVVLTGSTDEADQRRSEQLDVEAFLTKPVDLQKFLRLVRDLNRFWHADMILPSVN